MPNYRDPELRRTSGRLHIDAKHQENGDWDVLTEPADTQDQKEKSLQLTQQESDGEI